MTKRITILGATGSIGVSALDVVSRSGGAFTISGLAAGRNVRLLREQIEHFRPPVVAVLSQAEADQLRELLPPNGGPRILWGEQGYRELAADSNAELVLSAMVGAAGLLPTWEAIRAGKTIALANKETLVMAGEIVMEEARRRGVRVFPVDSEHSAVFQCLEGQNKRHVERIILTASGGPFLHRSKEDFASITVADALHHPNWKMGKKITVDSASMMNKGLEVIEARWLFDVPFERIEVCVHPQSIIHSMVAFTDGSVIAQLGIPDMRIPISYALCYPERMAMPHDMRLDFHSVKPLEFLPPDLERFPNLALAYEAGRRGGGAPTVLNAVNEVAVEAFVEGAISFVDMTVLIQGTMTEYAAMSQRLGPTPASIQAILDVDRWARQRAAEFILGMKK